MKTTRNALLGHHRHYMLTNFDELRGGPTLARQVWVANMEMAISVAKIAKGNFYTQNTLQQLNIPVAIPSNQPHPPVLNPYITTWTPPHLCHLPIATPGLQICHNPFSKTLYS